MEELIYRTVTMLAAVMQMQPAITFLRDRYFPTNPGTDIFSTEDVLIDIKDGVQKMAPVVLPRKKGITVVREGYRTDRWTPPFVAPQRTLTLDDLESRGFGEALFSQLTAEEKEAAILGQDLKDLEQMIANREESIAARCMLENGYILKQYADKAETPEAIDYEIRFYTENANPNEYVPAVTWDQAGADIYGDLTAMVRLLTSKGKPVRDFVASPAVIDALTQDETIYKMLDNRRMNMGDFTAQEMVQGVSQYGWITVAGQTLYLYSYDAQMQDDESGVVAPLFKNGECVLTAPGSGRGLYGAVKQMEADEKYHSYSSTRVPKYTSDIPNDIRTLRLASRPLLVPRYANPWISAKVFG